MIHEPNVPLIRKTLDWVDEQDKKTMGKEWAQSSWYQQGSWLDANWGATPGTWCETTYCFAGKVVFDAGYDLEEMVKENDSIQKKALELLGLPEAAAFDRNVGLFDGSLTPVQLRERAEHWVLDLTGERL